MELPKVFESEQRFLELVWDMEPVNSGALVKAAQQALNWKKPTTYTVIRRLCERGVLINENATVRALVSREQFATARTEELVQRDFGGSLPAFVAAFTRGRKLSERDAAELRRLIDGAEGK